MWRGFHTCMRPALEKHAWWLHGRYFESSVRDLWATQAPVKLGCPTNVSRSQTGSKTLLAQRVGHSSHWKATPQHVCHQHKLFALSLSLCRCSVTTSLHFLPTLGPFTLTINSKLHNGKSLHNWPFSEILASRWYSFLKKINIYFKYFDWKADNINARNRLLELAGWPTLGRSYKKWASGKWINRINVSLLSSCLWRQSSFCDTIK